MVRLKHRYLLLNILYPSPNPSSSSNSKPNSTSISPYLTFHAPSPSTLHAASLLRHLRASIASNFGDYGAGVTGPHLKVIYLSNATSTVIIRCPRAFFRLVWASLTFMDALPAGDGATKKCVIRVVRVSGTIRKAEEEVVRRARREIFRAKLAAGNEGALEGLMGSISQRVPDGNDEEGIEDLDDGEDDDMDDDSD